MSQPIVLIQARRNSTRLPNKINQLIGTKRMIDHVIDRVRKSGLKWSLAAAWGYPHIPEEDVLTRFHTVLHEYDPEGTRFDPVIRITGDCPLIDHGLIARALARYQEGDRNMVVTGSEWDGLDVEIFSRALLEVAYQRAEQPHHREHVTRWMRLHAPHVVLSLEGLPLRWSVDDAEGLNFVRSVMATCEYCAAGWGHRFRESRDVYRIITDIHEVYGLHAGGAPEPLACEAFDLLEEHRQEVPYVSH